MLTTNLARKGLLPLCIVGAAACSDDEDQPVAPRLPLAQAVAAIPDEAVVGDPFLLAVAREVPEFAGVYLDEEGRLEIAVTESSSASLARSVSLGLLPPRLAQLETTTRIVSYPFMELARYRTALREVVFDIEGVVSLGVQESANRVMIGVASETAREDVEGLLGVLGIPLEVVLIEERGRVELTALDLDDAEPSNKVQGGWKFEARYGEAPCTVGFNAIRRNSNRDSVVVVNSHCTDDPQSLDNGVGGQPIWQDSIGHEVSDPSGWGCSGNTCVEADAALFEVETATFDLGKIARTKASSGCENCTATLEIDTANPTIPITARWEHTIENETLHKVGQNSGWTYGAVESTCEDILDVPVKVKVLCTDRVDFSVHGGDSGSPVFEYNSVTGEAELRGAVWGREYTGGGNYDAFVQDLHQIEDHLGGLIVFDPGHPNASVTGPSSIGEDLLCTWTASVTSGIGPFTYEWTGLLTGTASNVSGVLNSSGWLYLEVEDFMGRVDTYSHYVSVTSGGPTPPACSE